MATDTRPYKYAVEIESDRPLSDRILSDAYESVNDTLSNGLGAIDWDTKVGPVPAPKGEQYYEVMVSREINASLRVKALDPDAAKKQVLEIIEDPTSGWYLEGLLRDHDAGDWVVDLDPPKATEVWVSPDQVD